MVRFQELKCENLHFLPVLRKLGKLDRRAEVGGAEERAGEYTLHSRQGDAATGQAGLSGIVEWDREGAPGHGGTVRGRVLCKEQGSNREV